MSNTCYPIDVHEIQEQGWWNHIAGYSSPSGLRLDQYHVIVPSPLGSPHGSTCPLETRPGGNGEHWGPDFPAISPADMADAHALLLDYLGIDALHAVVGGSMGGMQAMQFALRHPDRVDRCVAIASTGHTSPATVALRSVQRSAIRMDPAFRDGWYDPTRVSEWPVAGMSLARRFGTIAYRSRSEFDARFDWATPEDEQSDVERYLSHQASKFRGSYDPNCYLLLSEAMDKMDLSYGYSSLLEALSRFSQDKQVMLLPYNTDVLMPPNETLSLAKEWSYAGAATYVEVLESRFGHDAFLVGKEAAAPLSARLAAFLSDGVQGPQRVYEQTVRDLDGGL
eukprot:TRINITY_DN34118_c0_g1_i2.p1 TRINITY_DN34118_c0_g1~~TRINITY_DN34118_c0_g1_i2.p1  ORF type:complete len:338 (-),score=39.55 TRINITY_DN34118_c0_g1_i2:232-1245(-)